MQPTLPLRPPEPNARLGLLLALLARQPRRTVAELEGAGFSLMVLMQLGRAMAREARDGNPSRQAA